VPRAVKQPGLGHRLAACRLQRGLSQASVARVAGLNPSYLSRLERGQIQPTVATAMRIARAMKMSINDLVGPSPAVRKDRPCPISQTGECLLDLLHAAEDGGDSSALSPRQLRLLRRFTALLQKRNSKILDAFELLVSEMLDHPQLPHN